MASSIQELTIERVFNAPREQVFKAWTNKDLLAKWWGPRGVTTEVNNWEAKPQGKIDAVMVAGDALGDMKGQRWPMDGLFQEVQPPQKLVFISHAIQDGKPILENLCTVTFEDQDGQTKMTLHVSVVKATPEASFALSGMQQGWSESLEKLGELFQ